MQHSIPSAAAEPGRILEARYSYYRRCQVFRKGGEQCKAPAETGALICHAHAGQLAMAVRREQERRAVLEEALAEMRRGGRPECEMADLFMDFKGINVTLAVMARALIVGRIDCKTAGGLVVQLQTFSKLLWTIHRVRTKTLPLINTDDTDLKRAEEPRLPQISAEERRSKDSTTKDTKKHEGVREARSARSWAANRRKETLIAFVPKVLAFADISWPHGPPEWVKAA